MASSIPALQLKITLQGLKPPIWRRVVVRADVTLSALHDIVQRAMGWTDAHLHAFEIDGARYGCPSVDEFADDLLDERRHQLGALVSPRQRFTYEYDFGDGWRHQIIVEKALVPAPDLRLPTCIAGARACPPEDCGGVHGYVELLEALDDPEHERHDELLEWLGGPIDPEAFTLDDINAALAKLAPRPKRAPRARPTLH